MIHHFSIGYKVEGDDRTRRFYTYAEDVGQAVQQLYDTVPNVTEGNILTRLKAPAGARRVIHEY